MKTFSQFWDRFFCLFVGKIDALYDFGYGLEYLLNENLFLEFDTHRFSNGIGLWCYFLNSLFLSLSLLKINRFKSVIFSVHNGKKKPECYLFQ